MAVAGLRDQDRPILETRTVTDEDEQWDRFCREQERQDLTVAITHALSQVPKEQADQLRADFLTCIEGGGAGSSYAFTNCIDILGLPLLYPLVAEHFIQARVPPKELTQRERNRLSRQQRKLGKKLREASEAAGALSSDPTLAAQLAESLGGLAATFTRRASETEPPVGSSRPGRRTSTSTKLALELEDLFWEPNIPMTERSRLIAAVVSAFVEPVTGEQIRQRIKDHRRRPPSS